MLLDIVVQQIGCFEYCAVGCFDMYFPGTQAKSPESALKQWGMGDVRDLLTFCPLSVSTSQ